MTGSQQSTTQRNAQPVMASVGCRRLNTSREKTEERPRSQSCAALKADRGGPGRGIFKRAFYFSYLWNQVALSPSFFIFTAVGVLLLLDFV